MPDQALPLAGLADPAETSDEGERGPCTDDRAQENQLSVPADEDVGQGARRHAATPYLHQLVRTGTKDSLSTGQKSVYGTDASSRAPL
jgi:hypothetical protein